MRGDVSFQGLWEIQTDAIFYVRFGYYDADTWNPEGMYKLLDWWGEIKKYKHGQYFYDQWKHFSPFFISVDGMVGKEALVLLTTLS